MICLILYQQIKIFKNDNYKDTVMNVTLLTTLLSLLAHRMTASFIVLPYLWFIPGKNLGITMLQVSSSQR